MSAAARNFYTVEDWLTLPDDERCELIEGELVYKAMPSSYHSDSQTNIILALSNAHKSNEWWKTININVFYKGRQNGFIHDFAGWKKENYPNKPKGKAIIERPDWVCEILSEENRINDLYTKKWVLHEHRVPYYWLVDIDSELISVLEWSEKGYVMVVDANKSEKKALPPFDIEFDISVLLGNEPE